MIEMELSGIPKVFGINDNLTFHKYGNGLINDTFLIKNAPGEQFILQKVNKNIFTNPLDIDDNTRLIKAHIKNNFPDYYISLPIENIEGKSMIEYKGEFYRIFNFINNSHTIDTVANADQAYEASLQFGQFTSILSDLDTLKLKITLPNFHNLSLRFDQYSDAIKNGSPERIRQSKDLISDLSKQIKIVKDFNLIKNLSKFKLRITHHDTKISNVLFDETDKGICVIDLDTVMPGYFISDVGDMMRTYLSPVNEEEPDFSKIYIRDDVYKSIFDGYMEHMSVQLSEAEKRHFLYAGKFMIYMQAIRFLTDYLNNDIYYGASYEEQNFTRAGNQISLLKKLNEFEKSFN